MDDSDWCASSDEECDMDLEEAGPCLDPLDREQCDVDDASVSNTTIALSSPSQPFSPSLLSPSPLSSISASHPSSPLPSSPPNLLAQSKRQFHLHLSTSLPHILNASVLLQFFSHLPLQLTSFCCYLMKTFFKCLLMKQTFMLNRTLQEITTNGMTPLLVN